MRGLRAAAGTADDVVAKSLTLCPAKKSTQEMTLSGYAVRSSELIYSRRPFSLKVHQPSHALFKFTSAYSFWLLKVQAQET